MCSNLAVKTSERDDNDVVLMSFLLANFENSSHLVLSCSSMSSVDFEHVFV